MQATIFVSIIVSSCLCQESHSPSSSPSAVGSAQIASLGRIPIGILLGSLAGVLAAAALLLLFHFFLLVADRAPIIRGTVVFSPRISTKTLPLAIANQCQQPAQCLGSTSAARYYHVLLDDDLDVAVKVLKPPTRPGSSNRSVQRRLELLAQVKHAHVLSLRAYVRDRDRFLLVYDYCANGSLESAMGRVRDKELGLLWKARLRISVGIAKGLRYLHLECSPPILHFGLKPTNVLLDEDFEPRLGDCGLARLFSANMDGSSSFYTAPECFQSCGYTDKGDIYSFGMILAMLLTGRDSSDPFFTTEVGKGSLGRWLRHLQLAGEAREALDKALIREEAEEDEILMAVRIALLCLSDVPADRPSSNELVAMLTQLHSF